MIGKENYKIISVCCTTALLLVGLVLLGCGGGVFSSKSSSSSSSAAEADPGFVEVRAIVGDKDASSQSELSLLAEADDFAILFSCDPPFDNKNGLLTKIDFPFQLAIGASNCTVELTTILFNGAQYDQGPPVVSPSGFLSTLPDGLGAVRRLQVNVEDDITSQITSASQSPEIIRYEFFGVNPVGTLEDLTGTTSVTVQAEVTTNIPNYTIAETSFDALGPFDFQLGFVFACGEVVVDLGGGNFLCEGSPIGGVIDYLLVADTGELADGFLDEGEAGNLFTIHAPVVQNVTPAFVLGAGAITPPPFSGAPLLNGGFHTDQLSVNAPGGGGTSDYLLVLRHVDPSPSYQYFVVRLPNSL